MMEVKKAFRIVIDYLDEEMAQHPSQEMADASNLLEDELYKIREGEK